MSAGLPRCQVALQQSPFQWIHVEGQRRRPGTSREVTPRRLWPWLLQVLSREQNQGVPTQTCHQTLRSKEISKRLYRAARRCNNNSSKEVSAMMASNMGSKARCGLQWWTKCPEESSIADSLRRVDPKESLSWAWLFDDLPILNRPTQKNKKSSAGLANKIPSPHVEQNWCHSKGGDPKREWHKAVGKCKLPGAHLFEEEHLSSRVRGWKPRPSRYIQTGEHCNDASAIRRHANAPKEKVQCQEHWSASKKDLVTLW